MIIWAGDDVIYLFGIPVATVILLLAGWGFSGALLGGLFWPFVLVLSLLSAGCS